MKLTQTVQKGGCAAKVAASELRKILGAVTFPPKPSALAVDGALFDDAAIYRVSPEIALVQTLDFFTPIVDSPAWFGKVATANALSDVYAMGGSPKTAMAILAYPVASMEAEVVQAVLQGSCDLLAQAGVPLVGGHSIDDDTLKFGLSVTGFVHPDRVWANSGAKVGDRLLLTKALGTGTITAALKRGAIEESAMQDVLESMALLNDAAGPLKELAAKVHAATDITGFGLAGHSMQMAKASGVTLRFESKFLPCFARAKEFIREGFLTKAHASNRAYTKDYLELSESLGEEETQLAFDPQTSGGLLLSVAAGYAEEILAALRPNFPAATFVGEVEAAGAHAVRLR
jgi:selenide,water dikinase